MLSFGSLSRIIELNHICLEKFVKNYKESELTSFRIKLFEQILVCVNGVL